MVKRLFLFPFPSAAEAVRVLNDGYKTWEGGGILLDSWHSTAGRKTEGVQGFQNQMTEKGG